MTRLLERPRRRDRFDGGIEGSLRLRVAEHITQHDPAEWDLLLEPDDLQAHHRFVRACEEADIEDARYAHALLHDDRGPVALASFCAFTFLPDLLAPPWLRHVTRVVRDRCPRFLRTPIVVAGLPLSTGQSCFRVRRGASVDEAVRILEPVGERLAHESHARLLCFKELSTGEEALGAALVRRGYRRAASLPGCELSLPWDSFDEYVSAMRAGYRRQLVQTRRRAESAGLRWRVAPLGEHVSRLVPLYEQVMDQAEFQLERLPAAFFETLATHVPESRALLVEDAQSTLVCGAVLLLGPSTTTFLLAGVDHARCRPIGGYEYLTAAVVEQALAWQSRSVTLGQTSWAAKARLGARPSPRHVFLRWRGGAIAPIANVALPLLFPERTAPRRRVFRQSSST